MSSHQIYQNCSSRFGRMLLLLFVFYTIRNSWSARWLFLIDSDIFDYSSKTHIVWRHKTCQKCFTRDFVEVFITFSAHSKSKMVTLTSYWQRYFRLLTWTTTCKVTRLTRTVRGSTVEMLLYLVANRNPRFPPLHPCLARQFFFH